MPQISREIILSKTKEERRRKLLLASIKKKRIELQQFVVKTEMLRVNLEMAKQEYMVKVGSLFLKDNTLDLEIIRLRNILRFMDEGLTYEEAAEKIAQTYYAEQLEFEKERARIKHEEEIYVKREEHKPLITKDFKRLWKKLIARFHPDLVQNPIEKRKRETIMKQINRAYEEGDYEQLVKIEKDHIATKETTVENLEEILLMLMKEIEEQINLFLELNKSEWYEWMLKIEKAKKKDMDIFADTERRLLNDIVAKLDVVRALKNEIQDKEKGLVLV